MSTSRPAYCDGGFLLEDSPDGEFIWTKAPDFDRAVSDRASQYRERDLVVYGPELNEQATINDLRSALAEAEEETGADGSAITPLACGGSQDLTPDGQGLCKLVFGSDSRSLLVTPRSYPRNKHLMYRRQVGPYWVAAPGSPQWPSAQCSVTMVDEDHALTAAHCVYDTVSNMWLYQGGALPWEQPSSQVTPAGTDSGRGFVCRGGAISSEGEFAQQCEYVQSRWVLGGFVDATSETSMDAFKHDVAILKLRRANHPTGIGDGAWIALSSIEAASTLEEKIAIAHGYPGARPDGTANSLLYTAPWPESFAVATMDQYKTYGPVLNETSPTILAAELECGSGQSGSGIFYYLDDEVSYNGQGHFLIGMLSGHDNDDNGSPSGDYCGGPTIMQFRDWVYSVLP